MVFKGYLEIPDGQIHYMREDPPKQKPEGSVVFLHQKASSCRMWEPVLPLLAAQGYQAVAIDLPGHGESFQPKDGESFYSLPALGECVGQTIDQLKLCRPTLLVGHHLGAAVALQVAADFPGKIDKLAVWGVPIIDEEARRMILPPPDYEDEELKVVLHFWKIRDKFSGKPGYKMPWQVKVVRLLEMLQNHPKTTEMLYTMDVESLFERVKVPTLCMYGEKEMLKEQTIKTAEKVENAKVFVIPNGGIDVADEYPEEFTEALTQFLAGW